MAPEAIDRPVAVVGDGPSAALVTAWCALAGRSVRMVLASGDDVPAVLARVGVVVASEPAEDRPDRSDRSEVVAGIEAVTGAAAVAGCGLVVEAGDGDLAETLERLAAIGPMVDEGALVVTTAAALSVTRLAAGSGCPDRFAGLHIATPGLGAELVEIVPAEQTAPATVDALAAFVATLGRGHVVVKDRPGFLVHRLLMPYLNQVVRTYDAGLATAADIDAAVRLGLGYRRGPLELLEETGIGWYRRTAGALYEASRDPLFAPPPLLERLDDAGRDGPGTFAPGHE